MVITRSYAARLTELGLAHYGRRVKDQQHRVFLEVIRGERIDYVTPFGFDEQPKDPPCWHPVGLPDRLEQWPSEREKRASSHAREVPTHDVLTEHGEGYKAWRRPRKPVVVVPKLGQRRCPNCGELTNRRIHCAGVETVRLDAENAKKPAAKRVELPSVPRTHQRLCTVCKLPTNESSHCEQPTKERAPYRYRYRKKAQHKPLALGRVCECGDFTSEQVHCAGKRTFSR